MIISPNANNNVTLTTRRGISIEISDDGESLSIRRSLDPDLRKIGRIQGAMYDYEGHFDKSNEDTKFDVDVIRIDPI